MSDHFPCEVGLNDGTRVLLRPLAEHDGHALFNFFQRLPEGLRRLAWDDVDDRDTVESWAREVDYEATLPVIALDRARIIADATLHYRRRGPLRLCVFGRRVRRLPTSDVRDLAARPDEHLRFFQEGDGGCR